MRSYQTRLPLSLSLALSLDIREKYDGKLATHHHDLCATGASALAKVKRTNTFVYVQLCIAVDG